MTPDPTGRRPDRNLALELVRVTEAAALAAARLVGMGDKEAADQAAVDAMRIMLETVRMDGVVVIGEGEKDEAPMLYNGEHIGDGSPPEVDIAVDPLEGTRLRALGMPSALAVIALAPSAARCSTPGPCVYMEKIAGGGRDRRPARPRPARSARRSAWSPSARASTSATSWSSCSTARATRRASRRSARRARASRLITDGDVSAALLAVSDARPVDLLWGIGGTPEGVISAAAIKCIGRRSCSAGCGRATTSERQAALDAGYDLDRDPHRRRPRAGDDVLLLGHRRDRRRRAAGRALRGPRRAATTESLVMRSRSGTVRRIHARHNRPKLREITGGRYCATSAASERQRGPTSPAGAKRPTRDSARSRRASERRNPCVTMTWIRDCVCV